MTMASLTDNTTSLQSILDTVNNGYGQNIFDLIYPVGAVFIAVNDIDPTVLFGGTWEKIKDTFLLSSGDTYNVGSTGGEANVTLSETQVPNVTGVIQMHSVTNASNIHEVSGCFSGTIIEDKYFPTTDTTVIKSGADSVSKIYFDNGGTGASHNNMPPYLVVNMWKRVS